MGGRILTLTAINLVQEVEQAGGHLEVTGERLKVRAPKPLPDELVAALRAHKREIIGCLATASPIALAARSHTISGTILR